LRPNIPGDSQKDRPDFKRNGLDSLSRPYRMAAGLVDGMVTPFAVQRGTRAGFIKRLIPIRDKVKVVRGNEEFEALFPSFSRSR